MKKPRADATLKTLPEDRQAAISDYARTHTLTETVTWLHADGLQTSSAALSLFLSSYRLSQRLTHNESTVETLLAKLQTTRTDWTAEQLNQAGQAFFSALAIDEQDADVWTATQRLQLDRDSAKTRFEFEDKKIKLREKAEERAREKLKLEARKLALAEATATAKQAVEEVGKKGGKLDPETKAEILAAIDQKLLGL